VREPGADPADAARFAAGWQAPGFRTRADWIEAFAAAGLRIEAEIDLSALVRDRGAAARAVLGLANRIAALVPHAGWRGILSSHLGGLALERLHAAGGASYRLFVAL
jgi:hypothetical protein